jgi:hypothetical protein
LYGFPRPFAQVAVAKMGSLRIVVIKPFIQVSLKLFNAFIELGAKGDAEEFIQDSAVETLHEPVGPGSSNLASAVFDVIESKVDPIRMGLCAAKFLAVIGKNSFNIDPESAIKGNNVIMEHRNGGLSLFGGVKKAEGITREGIHNGMKVDFPYTFQGANEKSILVEELSWATRFHVTLSETRVLFFNESNLLCRKFNGSFRVLFSKASHLS